MKLYKLLQDENSGRLFDRIRLGNHGKGGLRVASVSDDFTHFLAGEHS